MAQPSVWRATCSEYSLCVTLDIGFILAPNQPDSQHIKYSPVRSLTSALGGLQSWVGFRYIEVLTTYNFVLITLIQ